MDPFTQKIFERAQQRSKNLGVSKTAEMPLTEINNTMSSSDTASTAGLDSNFYFHKATSMTPEKSKVTHYKRSPNKKEILLNSNNGRSPNKEQNRLQVSQRKIEIDNNKESSHKIHRQFSVDKENMDIEINITTGPNVDVQVEVKEQNVDNDDENSSDVEAVEEKNSNNIIRDSSRNRLQRLGALYSNTNDLSSPIHRTEGKFHADTSAIMDKSRQTKKISKLNKLTALANSINDWEDDTSHPDYRKKNPTSTSPDRTPSHSIATNKYTLPVNKNSSPLKKNTSPINKCSAPMNEDSSPMKSNTKNTKTLKWDDKVMNSLEAQGFQRRESSTTKLSYEYKNVGDKKTAKSPTSSALTREENSNISKIDRNVEKNQEKNKSKISATAQNIKSGLVSGRAAVFENKAIENTQPVKKPQKDPAEMSLKERMQLFEKNKGTALIPKAPFALSAPMGKIQGVNKSQVHQFQMPQSKVNTKTETKLKDKIEQLGFGGSTISETNIKNDILKQKQQDMDIIAQRYNKVESTNQTNVESMPPPPPPLPVQSQTQGSYKRISPPTTTERTEEETKRQKLNPNRLYPVLSDLETTDGEMDNCTTATVSCDSEDEKKKYFANLSESPMEEEDTVDDDDADDISNVSLGREILQHVQRNEMKGSHNISQKKKAVRYADQQEYYEDSSFNTSEESAGVEDYLDEALEDESDVTDDYNNSNKYGTKSSNSFSYQKPPKKYEGHKSISEQNEVTSEHPVTSELTVNKSSDENMLTLVHTVSFYRKQQSNSNSVNNTPIRKVLHESKSKIEEISSSAYSDEDCESTTSSELENAYLVDEKIKRLLDEICKQQQVIAQTSQALNLCAATIEFSGSSESVEGERHLLVATHRRQVALDEVQRLRVERTIRPVNSAKEKGSLVVKDINVPLRQDYIRKLSSDAISGHHLVCLLKYNENVIATKTVPTLPGLLAVKFPDVLTLNNVYADFRITLEVYGMTAQREILPHEIKYHINLNKKSGRRTPKKASDSRLIMPMVQSPGGPNVVRTPALVQYGFAIFSLKEIQRNSWTLTQVSGVSPLDGIINMRIQCELSVSIEYKGFLTMFEDISGFGAWHRRWCFLNGHVLNYWKYPDDQNKKTPMGSIDLNSCVSPRIGTAPRDICARLNTMLLECQRPAQESDVESFLIIPKGKNTIVRYLLSADTKEERSEWCAHLNKAITLIRAWGTPQ